MDYWRVKDLSIKKALMWVAIWIGLALVFNFGVFIFLGPAKSLEFLGGYIIEQSLSIDNLFLFVLVFSSFGISARHQRRVLNWGIAGAIILRLIFVVLGVAAVNAFHWILYVFGIILIFSGIKMAFQKEGHKDLKESKVIKLFGKLMPITETLEGEKFFVRRNKILYATPLLAILVLIEFTDIIFAIDSIPAIFSITRDPFIVYTSNIFAIMGLRSMYFVLEKLHQKFQYVKYGVALILVFTGVKLSILFFNIEIPIELSLLIIFSILASSIVASFGISRSKENRQTKKVRKIGE